MQQNKISCQSELYEEASKLGVNDLLVSLTKKRDSWHKSGEFHSSIILFEDGSLSFSLGLIHDVYEDWQDWVNDLMKQMDIDESPENAMDIFDWWESNVVLNQEEEEE